jgi:hypothetical protein
MPATPSPTPPPPPPAPKTSRAAKALKGAKASAQAVVGGTEWLYNKITSLIVNHPPLQPALVGLVLLLLVAFGVRLGFSQEEAFQVGIFGVALLVLFGLFWNLSRLGGWLFRYLAFAMSLIVLIGFAAYLAIFTLALSSQKFGWPTKIIDKQVVTVVEKVEALVPTIDFKSPPDDFHPKQYVTAVSDKLPHELFGSPSDDQGNPRP